MKCPECGSYNTYVLDSRQASDERRRRRYRCRECGTRYNTKELYDFDVEDTGRIGRLSKVLRELKDIVDAALNGGG